jgi:hypothetical protein
MFDGGDPATIVADCVGIGAATVVVCAWTPDTAKSIAPNGAV